MLPGVLLHVIKTALPVDGAVHRSFSDRCAGDMHHRMAIALEDVQHSGAPEPAEVIRLPARRGIERRAVQLHVPLARDRLR